MTGSPHRFASSAMLLSSLIIVGPGPLRYPPVPVGSPHPRFARKVLV